MLPSVTLPGYLQTLFGALQPSHLSPFFFFFSAWELTVFPCILPFFFQPFACTRELDGFVRASPWLKGERQKWQLCSLAIDGEQRKIGAGLCLSLGM